MAGDGYMFYLTGSRLGTYPPLATDSEGTTVLAYTKSVGQNIPKNWLPSLQKVFGK